MKNRVQLIITFIVMLFITLTGCKKKSSSEDPTPIDEKAISLNGDWYLPNAGGGMMVDGVDRSINYPDFKMSFSSDQNGGNKRYSTQNAGNLFNASGSWDWASTTKQALAFDDGKTLTIQSLQATRVVFTFNHTSGGVRAGISGNYIMTLEKR